MKVFVVLLTLVATSVCADDVVWESAELSPLVPHAYVYQNMPVPKSSITKHPNGDVKTNSTQDQSKNAMLPTKQPRADPSDAQSQALSQYEKEDLKINRKGNEIAENENTLTDEGNRIQRQLFIVGVITIGTQVILTIVQFIFIRAANKYAGTAAVAAAESARIARVALEVAERADLIVEQCSFEEGFDINPLKITLPMTNTGRTRATIVASIVQGFVGTHPPAPLNEDKLLQRTLEGFIIPSQRRINHHCSLPPIILESIQAVREGKVALYIHGRVQYRDGFREVPRDPYETPFLMRYDIQRGQFLVLSRNTNAEDTYI